MFPGDRLDEHGRKALAVLRHRRSGRVDVVVGDDDRVAATAGGTPGEDGIPSVASPEPADASSASA